jgi:hypothetical protein
MRLIIRHRIPCQPLIAAGADKIRHGRIWENDLSCFRPNGHRTAPTNARTNSFSPMGVPRTVKGAHCVHSGFPVSSHSANEIIFHDGRFWVASRNRLFGPFDYQWSLDLHGLEFTYQGMKFGEVCSEDEFYADLKPCRLPITVCRVVTVVVGNIAAAIRSGTPTDQRDRSLEKTLRMFGLSRFSVREA